jgi:uncharacterized membrane protein YjgN (DUF898 family)
MMDAMTPVAAVEPQPVHFDGRLSGFVGLALGNLLLTIITLGVYRFWAKTRVRRHLWERTLFQGEPLEYRGRGIEKFIGALIVGLVLFVPLIVVSMIAALLIASKIIWAAVILYLVMYLALIWLIGVGIYRSQRYMFSRTAWRGIRGGMVNGGWTYGLLFLKLTLLSVLTLGFMSPYVATRLWNARMNDAMFGSAQIGATANWRPVYSRFLVAWIGALVIYIVAIGVVGLTLGPDLAALKPGAPPSEHPDVLIGTILKLYGVMILAGIAIGLLLLRYHAALLRELFGQTSLDTLGFRFDATAGDLLKFALVNFAIVVFTFGLGTIFMPFRVWTFYVRHLSTVGSLDADALLQTSLAAPVQGDGLADAFDAAAF